VCGAALAGILGLGWVAAQAQQHHEDAAGMGMKMEMMSGAEHQAAMTPFVLPGLQSELGLSAQQITQLRQLKQDMLSKGKEISGQIAAKRKELDGLLAAGTSKAELVKRLYEEIGSLGGQEKYAAYEATSKMKAELTDAQRAKLAGIKRRCLA
jgi:Spy/CpxP family protein refolding chaperone